jgi:GntR family transcriptional regulator
MIPFTCEFKAGIPVSQQVVYAVEKAVILGGLKPGDKFPSVRVLSQELKINPNTAHRVIAELVSEGILEVHPGIGTIIAMSPPATQKQRTQLLGPEFERLVVEAKKYHLSFEEVQEALRQHWKELSE